MMDEMVEEVRTFEVTRVERMIDGSVKLAPRTVGVSLMLFLGLLMVGFGFYSVLGGFSFAFVGLFALVFGGMLVYIGAWGLSSPAIKIDVPERAVSVQKPGKAPDHWNIAAVCREKPQPFSISGLRQMGMGIVRARLYLEDNKTLTLFLTGNRSKAMRVAQWINDALEIARAS